MCGISGFWQAGGVWDDKATRVLEAMNNSLRHRGPDGEGIWINTKNKVGFAHRRLSIRDLSSTGSQPMISANDRFIIIFNGEVYNTDELKACVGQSGHVTQWRGTSDTEVLLETIGAFGVEDALRRMIGMFALAVWDIESSSLFLARDRCGEKPLYYSHTGSTLVFGSELRALLCHPTVSVEIDQESIGLFLRYGYIPAPRSIYLSIKKLVPGELIEFKCRKEGLKRTSRPYWQAESDLYGGIGKQKKFSSVSVAATELQPILENAVSRELVSDVPIGAFLSGGIDSSLIVSVMQRLGQGRTKTFTVGFDDPAYDEAPFAREVARYLGTEHLEHYVGQCEIFNIIPMLPVIYDEPLGDSSAIPTVLVAQMARQSVTVCLSGDGGDELFGGYNHYQWGKTVLRARKIIPDFIDNWTASLCVSIGLYNQKQRIVKFGELIKAHPKADPLRLLNTRICDLTDVMKDAPEEQWPLPPFPKNFTVAEKLMAIDMQGYLPDDILSKVDRATMRVGLESRAPFLDHVVADFAWSLPLSMRLGASGKEILRSLLAKFLPPALFERPKRGFGLPLHRWFRDELKPLAEKYLFQVAQRYDCWLNREGIVRMWNEHQSGKMNRQQEIWTIMMLLMWFETHEV
jgi:asparagine synthase (glutamine-hydrolysing)